MSIWRHERKLSSSSGTSNRERKRYTLKMYSTNYIIYLLFNWTNYDLFNTLSLILSKESRGCWVSVSLLSKLRKIKNLKKLNQCSEHHRTYEEYISTMKDWLRLSKQQHCWIISLNNTANYRYYQSRVYKFWRGGRLRIYAFSVHI